MYPYNINSNFNKQSAQANSKRYEAAPISIQSHEDSDCSEAPPTPSSNKYIIEMLREAVKDELTDAKYYDSLAEALECDEDRKAVYKIHKDEIKHSKMFSDIYSQLTGEAPNVTSETKRLSDNLLNEFSNNIFNELQGVEFYRKLLFAFLNLEFRDALYEIITDEQAHAQIMNYLYSKHNQ